MIRWLTSVLHLAVVRLKSRRNLLLEILALRHQLFVLSQSPKRPRLTPLDRVFLDLAFPSLGWMEDPAAPGSTRRGPSVASRRVSTLLAMEKLSSQNRPESHFPRPHHLDPGHGPRQSVVGRSQDSR
jgi:hypothetical protein